MHNNKELSKKIAGTSGHFEKERDYWMEKMQHPPSRIHFPYDYPGRGQKKEPAPSLTGEYTFQVKDEIYLRLMELSKKNDHTLHTILVSQVKLLLNKYTGETDIIVGMPIYRQQEEADYVNTVLVLRNTLEHTLTFKEWLLRVRRTIMEANENQNFPIEILEQEFNLELEGREFSLFDTAILLTNIQEDKDIEPTAARVGYNTQFQFFRDENQESLRAKIRYNPDLYHTKTIEQMSHHFLNLLTHALDNLDTKLSDMEVMTESEKERIRVSFNDTAFGKPVEKQVHQMIQEQCQKFPAFIAAQEMKRTGEKERQITYEDLQRKGNTLAHHLELKGVSTGAVVGIFLERSLELLMGIVGILKAGACYLPISTEIPQARKAFMVQDSGAKLIICHQANPDVIGGELNQWQNSQEILQIEAGNLGQGIEKGSEKIENQKRTESQDPQLCYVLYTSGTTGTPKAVMVEHRGLANYITWASRTYVQGQKLDFPLYTSISFDLTVTSIFTPLVTGNKVIIYHGDEGEFLLARVLADNLVGVIKLTPSHLKLIKEMDLNNRETSRLRSLIVGGEKLGIQLAKEIYYKFNETVAIYNEYGPTETVVGSMIYQYDPHKDAGETVPIGIPIDHTQIYILDQQQLPVPPGGIGEIYISGQGVARGYLKREQLTSEKFLPNPFVKGKKQRMYRTGDLGRMRPDGQMEYLGRKDQQVKIRGYRIETGEIENCLKNFKLEESRDTVFPKETTTSSSNTTPTCHCTQCLLPDNYEGITFDEKGVCHICSGYEEIREYGNGYFKKQKELNVQVNRMKRDHTSDYDCLLLFSGGKDSTYVLYRLIELGLKVLTFTFDNGYISEAAFKNIQQITTSLGVENIIYTAENMDSVFVESLRANHNVCNGCWNALNTIGIKIAFEKGINTIVSGLSRGQIMDMRLNGLFQTGIFEEQEIEEKLLLFRKSFHSKENRFYKRLNIDIPEKALEQVTFIDYFRYDDIPVKEIKAYLQEQGWVQPKDTGFCSSNCIINDVGIYMYIREHGYHFYAAPLSWDCRLGVITREIGLEETNFKGELSTIKDILDNIGYYQSVKMTDAKVVTTMDKDGNAQLNAFLVSDTELLSHMKELREYLFRELPHYMMPAHFFQVSEIPLTSNGKVDHAKLLQTKEKELRFSTTFIPPGNEREKMLATLCQEVFHVQRVGIADNFFDLGATSFEVIQLNNRLKETLNIEIPVLVLFEYSTISLLMQYLDNQETGAIAHQEKEQIQEEEEWMESMSKGKNKLKQRRQRGR
jgi:amino acid adenylation domain-containing protein